MNVLVTGAGGFLGRHLTQRLAADGHSVTALVWPSSTAAALDGMPVRIAVADICDDCAVTDAIPEEAVIVHCAGKVDDWGPREDYYRVNLEGTRTVLDAALKAGVRHFVHVSSLAILGVPKVNPIDESMPCPDTYPNPYAETKALSENLVLRYAGERDLPATIVRPGMLWGPGDSTIFPRLVRLAKMRLLVRVGSGRNILCLTYVTNMVDALLLAAAAQPEAQIYHITDTDTVTSREYFRALSDMVGVRQLPGFTPVPLARATAGASEFACRLGQAVGIRFAPLLTRYGLTLWSSTMISSPAKAREKLGYRQHVSFQQGMRNLADWYATIST